METPTWCSHIPRNFTGTLSGVASRTWKYRSTWTFSSPKPHLCGRPRPWPMGWGLVGLVGLVGFHASMKWDEEWSVKWSYMKWNEMTQAGKWICQQQDSCFAFESQATLIRQDANMSFLYFQESYFRIKIIDEVMCNDSPSSLSWWLTLGQSDTKA